MDARLFAMYVGPDQMMPVMSVLATIMGFLMIFWNKVVLIFRKIFGLKPPETSAPPEGPEQPNGDQPD